MMIMPINVNSTNFSGINAGKSGKIARKVVSAALDNLPEGMTKTPVRFEERTWYEWASLVMCVASVKTGLFDSGS